MDQLSKIAVALAVSMLMLHTLLPHTHHEEMTFDQHISEHENAKTFIDYLQLAFHSDPGTNHLEEFQASNHVDLKDFLGVQSSITDSPEFGFNSQTAFVFEGQFIAISIHDHVLSFRGPPALI